MERTWKTRSGPSRWMPSTSRSAQVVHEDPLRLQAALHRPELVAQPAPPPRSAAAAAASRMRAWSRSVSSPSLPSRKATASSTLRPYSAGGQLVDAGGRAAVDLVEDAGALAVVEDVVGAGAQLEPAVHDAQRLADGAGAGVGAEPARPVVLALPGPAHLQARERVAPVEPEDDEVLVVAQPDVEARPVLLDELVLEEHRLLLGAGHHHVEVAEQAVEQRDEVAVVAPPGVEVAADPGAQRRGLADVDHRRRPGPS